jgi:hypothetical protein
MEKFLKLADGKQSVSVYDTTRRATFDIISLVTILILYFKSHFRTQNSILNKFQTHKYYFRYEYVLYQSF